MPHDLDDRPVAARGERARRGTASSFARAPAALEVALERVARDVEAERLAARATSISRRSHGSAARRSRRRRGAPFAPCRLRGAASKRPNRFVWPRSRSRLAARERSSAISIDANASARVMPRAASVVSNAPHCDERLEDALVDPLRVDARREVEEIVERPAFLCALRAAPRAPRRRARARRRARSGSAGRTRSFATACARRTRDLLVAVRVRVDDLEVDVALVDVGRQHRDAHRARIGDRANDLVDLLLVAGHDPAEELDGVMRLEVRGLVRDERVRGASVLLLKP